MTRQEFIDGLSAKLCEGMTPAEVLNQVQFYQGYIDGEMSRGRSEQEVIRELGDPTLIARNILESPGTEETFFGTSAPGARESYAEGAYQGRNSDPYAGDIRAEEAEEIRPEETENEDGEPDFRSGESENEDGEPDFRSEETDREEGGPEDGFAENRRDENGGEKGKEDDKEGSSGKSQRGRNESTPLIFSWTLFALLMAAVIVIAGIIWVITGAAAVIGPFILIILAIWLIVYFISNNPQL